MKKKLFVWLLTMGIITSGFCVNIDAMDMDLMTLSSSESFSTMISSEEGISVPPEASPETPIPTITQSAEVTEASPETPIPTITQPAEVTEAPPEIPTPAITQPAEVTPTPPGTPTPMITQPAEVTPTPPGTSFHLSYQSESLKWENHTTVSLQFSVNRDCTWYYFFVDAGTDTKMIQNMYDASRATNVAEADTSFTVKATNVPEADTWLVVCARPDLGKAKMSIFKLNTESFKKKRPASAVVSTRAARIYKVTQSKITGLEKPLKFTPGTFYDFRVTGAGQNDKAPYVSSDERWIPLYWSLSKNPVSSAEKNTTFRIGSPRGITEARTYNIYVFFKKQVYNGAEWQDTDVIESVTQKFTSVAIKKPTPTPKPVPKLNTKSVVLRQGQSTSAVKVTNATSGFRVVAWYSDNTSIARVNANGKITAGKKAGSTYVVVVMSNGRKAKVKVTVQKDIVRTKSISGLKAKYTISKGKTVTLKPVLSPVTSQEKIIYSSSNKKIVSVSAKGVVKGVKAGSAKITVKSGRKKVILTVTVPKVTTKKITGIKSAMTLKKGKESRLTPKISPSNSDDKISYSSSDSKVVTVNSKGALRAKKKGTAVITVKSGKVQVKCKITVK